MDFLSHLAVLGFSQHACLLFSSTQLGADELVLKLLSPLISNQYRSYGDNILLKAEAWISVLQFRVGPDCSKATCWFVKQRAHQMGISAMPRILPMRCCSTESLTNTIAKDPTTCHRRQPRILEMPKLSLSWGKLGGTCL